MNNPSLYEEAASVIEDLKSAVLGALGGQPVRMLDERLVIAHQVGARLKAAAGEVPVLTREAVSGGEFQLVQCPDGLRGQWRGHPGDAWQTVPARFLVPEAQSFTVLALPSDVQGLAGLLGRVGPQLGKLSGRMRRHLQASEEEEG